MARHTARSRRRRGRLDYPRRLSLGRLLRRTVRRLRTREAVCDGGVEAVRKVLSSGSIIAWHFCSFARRRDRMRAALAAPDGPPVLRFTSPRQLEAWIAGLGPPTGSAGGPSR